MFINKWKLKITRFRGERVKTNLRERVRKVRMRARLSVAEYTYMYIVIRSLSFGKIDALDTHANASSEKKTRYRNLRYTDLRIIKMPTRLLRQAIFYFNFHAQNIWHMRLHALYFSKHNYNYIGTWGPICRVSIYNIYLLNGYIEVNCVKSLQTLKVIVHNWPFVHTDIRPYIYIQANGSRKIAGGQLRINKHQHTLVYIICLYLDNMIAIYIEEKKVHV